MNDEPDWTKIYVAWGFAVALVLICLIAAIWHYNWATTREAINAGLEQQAVPGARGVYWVTRKDKK